MIGKSPNQQQRELFRPLLSDFIEMRHELVLLRENIQSFGKLTRAKGQKQNGAL